MVIDKYIDDEGEVVWCQPSYWMQKAKFFIIYDEDQERVYQRPKIEYWIQTHTKYDPVMRVESFCTEHLWLMPRLI